MTLNPEDILLLQCVKPHISQLDFEQIVVQTKLVSNWAGFVNNATKNGLAPLAYKTIIQLNDKSNIPETVIETLQKYYYKTLSKNTLFYDSFKTIITKWNENNISAVALKGIYLADNVYGDIGLRQLSDMDLLVSKDDAENAAEILLEMGFEYLDLYKSDFIKQNKSYKHLVPLVRNGISVEIHKFISLPELSYHISISEFWNNTQKAIIADTSLLKLQPHYLLLHICLHLDEHVIDDQIHFIAYIDILWVLDAFKQEVDWSIFSKMCKEYNCSSNVYKHLFLCHKYLQATIPDWVIAEAKPFCDDYAECFFVNKLQCNEVFTAKKRNRNITDLQQISGFWNKLRFLFNDMFPSKSYMYYRYKFKNPKAIYWYYIVRQFDGLKSAIKYIFRIKYI